MDSQGKGGQGVMLVCKEYVVKRVLQEFQVQKEVWGTVVLMVLKEVKQVLELQDRMEKEERRDRGDFLELVELPVHQEAGGHW